LSPDCDLSGDAGYLATPANPLTNASDLDRHEVLVPDRCLAPTEWPNNRVAQQPSGPNNRVRVHPS